MRAEPNYRPGSSFQAADVAENYRYRPPYPTKLFDMLVEIAPRRGALLDLGCGPGKIARPLSQHFRHVTAVDPSGAMIAAGRSLQNGGAPNIEWIVGFAEDLQCARGLDLTVAAASIHWMDHGRLFERLRNLVSPDHIFAVVSGDDACEPAWRSDWLNFLAKWVPTLTGYAFDPGGFAKRYPSYETYVEIRERRTFVSAPFTQTIADYIRCQHSRETFAPSRMGAHMATFDAELAGLLRPHAVDGNLTFCVSTSLEWGVIK